MKILFVFGGKQKGGAERVITNIANHLINNNEIYFLGLKKIDEFYSIDKKIKYYLMESETDYSRNFLVRNVKRLKKIKKIVKDINPNIIISFSREQSYRILLLNYFNKRKIIVSVRNDPRHEYTTLFEKIIMQILYRRVNGFVFQTEDAKNFFPKKMRINSVIIPNPVNEKFLYVNKNVKKTKKIVSVGRLVNQKNHELLIDSFSKIADEFKEYKLIIYGSGELKKKLQNKINSLCLEKRIILAGEVFNVKKSIEDAKLFVLSSNYEGMPNALIEAMAIGLPVISTDCPCGGPRFLIKNNENGILVPVNDINKMVSAIKYILSNYENANKMGREAMKIVKKLNPEKINKMWIEYINKIIESGDKLGKKK